MSDSILPERDRLMNEHISHPLDIKITKKKRFFVRIIENISNTKRSQKGSVHMHVFRIRINLN